MMDSILPGYDVTPATWIYLSLVLVIAVFFRFNRLWSLRNIDLLLFLAASPGLYLVEKTEHTGLGYSWLFSVSGLFLVRLLVDPLLRRRPHLGQNLNSQGSGFLCVAAFALLALQAVQDPPAAPSIAVTAAPKELEGSPDQPADSAPPGAAGPALELIAAPIDHMFQDQAARVIAVLSHLVVIFGLLYVGRNVFNDVQLGLAMATLYLLLPCTAFDVGEVHHVLPAALTVWALVAYRRPMISGILLGVACGVMFFPVFLLPLWAAYYGRRGALRFVTALLLVGSTILSIAALTSSGPDSFLQKTFGTFHPEILAFHPPEGAIPDGFWRVELYAYRIPVIVTFFLMLAAMTIWPRRKSVEHLTAFSAAIIVATQFWYPVQGGVYLLWYLPLLLVVVFRPRLAHLVPQDQSEQIPVTRASTLSGPHAVHGIKSAERNHLFR
jgi:hypothetical protein